MAKDRPAANVENTRWIDRALNTLERLGNKLPDPAALFLILLVVVWVLSALLAPVSFSEIDPRNGQAAGGRRG